MIKQILILYIFITKELILSKTNNEEKTYSFLISIFDYDILSISVKESEQQKLKNVNALKNTKIERVSFKKIDEYLDKYLKKSLNFYLVSFNIQNDYTIPADNNTIMEFIGKYKPVNSEVIVEKPLLRVNFNEILNYSENLNTEILCNDQNLNVEAFYTQKLFLLHEDNLYPAFITVNKNDLKNEAGHLDGRGELLKRMVFYFENYTSYQDLTKKINSLYGFMNTIRVKNVLDTLAKTFNPLLLNISRIEQINEGIDAIHTIFKNEYDEFDHIFSDKNYEYKDLLPDGKKRLFLDSMCFFYLNIYRLINEMFLAEGSNFFIDEFKSFIGNEPSDKEIYLKFLNSFEDLRSLENPLSQYLMTQCPESNKLMKLTYSFDEILYKTVIPEENLISEMHNLSQESRKLRDDQYMLKYAYRTLKNDVNANIATNNNIKIQLNELSNEILEKLIELVNLETEISKLEDFYSNCKLPSVYYSLKEVKKTLKQKKKEEISEFDKTTVSQLDEFIKTYPHWTNLPIHFSVMFLAENNDKINQLIALYGVY